MSRMRGDHGGSKSEALSRQNRHGILSPTSLRRRDMRASPSGKASASQADTRGFESRCPLHMRDGPGVNAASGLFRVLISWLFFLRLPRCRHRARRVTTAVTSGNQKPIRKWSNVCETAGIFRVKSVRRERDTRACRTEQMWRS